MQTRTSELRRTATELADRLAGTEHQHLAADLRDAVIDLTGSIDAVHRVLTAVMPTLDLLASPAPTPGPRSDEGSPTSSRP